MSIPANTTCYGKQVSLKVSGEVGTITGFARHMRNKQPQFFVEYCAADGRAADAWFYADQLTLC